MGDRPILFSAPMIRALLDGRKTQTRRVVNPIPHDPALRPGMTGYKPAPLHLWQAAPSGPYFPPRYVAGDRLWVREACATWIGDIRDVAYRADETDDEWANLRHDAKLGFWKLRPSIHMPRWASRITLTVTDVRVQRLNEISEADAQAEGAPPIGADDATDEDERSHRWGFINLWNSLHGPGAWAQNPWVAAYTFTVARGNIDQLVTP